MRSTLTQRQGWICLLRGLCLQVHHLIMKGRGGNFGHVSRPGSQDNVRVNRNLSSTESSSSKGLLWSPDRTIEISQEGTRGGLGCFNLLAPFRNLTMRFPRDRLSNASWCAAIAATYTFKMEGDSLRSNLSFRKESTTPIVHLQGSSRREIREHTPLQDKSLPRREGSGLSDSVFHRRWEITLVCSVL